MGLVGKRAQHGQQEQRQHVIQRHDHTGERIADGKALLQDQRDDGIVDLPERTDGQERKPCQDGSLGVEFLHGAPPCF